MIVLSDCVGIETHFKLQLLFGFEQSLSDLNLKNSFFFNLLILQEPIDIFLIDIADDNSNEFGIAAIWLCDYFSFEINDRRLKYKLRIDALAFN